MNELLSRIPLQAEPFPSIIHLLWPLSAIMSVAAVIYFVVQRTRSHGNGWNHALRVHDSLRQLQNSLRVHGERRRSSAANEELHEALREATLARDSAQKLGRRRFRNWSRAIRCVGECKAAGELLVQPSLCDGTLIPGLDENRLRALSVNADQRMELVIGDLRQFMGGATVGHSHREPGSRIGI